MLEKGQCARLRRAVGARINQLTADRKAQGLLFRSLYASINERFNIDSYSKLPQEKLQDALRFVAYWKG